MKKVAMFYNYIIVMIFLLNGTVFAAEKVYFYHTDPAGTPLAMTDTSGNVVWRAVYKPFGEEQSITGTVENNEKFVGKEKDKETETLMSFGARYMKAEIGRFTSTDPVGPVDPRTSKTDYKMLENPQKLNRYAYAGNNPIRYIDPDGQDWFYSQYTGRLLHVDNLTMHLTDYGIVAYSGRNEGLNNPNVENRMNVGPIIQVTYMIGKMQDNTTQEGKVLKDSMRLEPDKTTAARIKEEGRTGGFLIHAGNWETLSSSSGCIVGMDLKMRETINDSGDRILRVMPQLPLLIDKVVRPVGANLQ